MRNAILAIAAAAMLALGASAQAAIYNGNGATGFGGPLGNGSLSITDDGTNVTFTLNNASGFSGNDVVVYIDSVSGGFADTSQFMDNGDGGRESISGYNAANPSQTLAVFPAGFGADYALEFENDTYDGLFGLVVGGNNSLNYVAGNGPSTTGGPYVVTFPLSDIGITSGDGFNFVASLISTSAYRSNETIGASVSTDGTTIGNNPGFSGSTTFTASESYGSVPEPASLGLIAGAVGLLASRRRSA